MIDNIKFKVLEREVLEHHIKETQVIDLSTSLNLFTAEEALCPTKGKYFNMEVVLSCQGAYIKGSVHKLTNLLKGRQGQNYNDLSFCSAWDSIAHLIEVLRLDRKTSLTNLEFGLNIGLSHDPQQVLDYNLLMYDNAGHNKDLKFRGKGDYKEFHKTDYSLKIYNKSKQYGLKSNILRVEVKIISRRKLQQLGIFSLEDLQREEVINRLYSFLWGELQKLTIIDDYTGIKMPSEDLNSLNEYTNPNYWKKLSRDKSSRVKNNRRQKFKALIVKYGLDVTQKEILTRVLEKFSEMMGCLSHNKIAA
jgi:hypothetical protein